MKRACSLILVCFVVACAGGGMPREIATQSALSATAPAPPNGLHAATESEATSPTATTDVSRELAEEYAESADPRKAWIVRDPIKPWNVLWFHFNNKFQAWVLKPISVGWRYLLYPRPARIGVKNFLDNLGFPGRFFNNLLQGKPKETGVETARFLTNSTIGVLGFWDPAERLFHLEEHYEDFGQTLGVWRVPHGIYITWPFRGPSSIRETLGSLGEGVLNPLATWWPVSILYRINDLSLGPDDYETLLRSAVNPYVAVRNAFIQNREKAVKE